LSVSNANFKEEDYQPSDSEIVEYTYRYVRNDGEPDGRYGDNTKIPRMKYYELAININNEANVTFMFSNAKSGKKFAEALANYITIFR